MLRYKVKSLPPKYTFHEWKQREAFVVLPVDDEEQRAKYVVEGDPQFAATIKRVLESSKGLAGYPIYEETTAVHLQCAMFDARMRPYQPELIEGEEIFQRNKS